MALNSRSRPGAVRAAARRPDQPTPVPAKLIFVKPAEGQVFRDPANPRVTVPATGVYVPETSLFWARRLGDGSAVLAEPPPEPEPEQPAAVAKPAPIAAPAPAPTVAAAPAPASPAPASNNS